MIPYEWEEHPEFLNFHEYVPHGRKLNKGDSIRIDHGEVNPACTGESTSMSIRHTTKGVILAKCWRCGRKGVYRGDKEVTLPRKVDGRWISDATYIPQVGKRFALPIDMKYTWRTWPIEAISWVKKARLTEEITKAENIGYSPSLRKLVLPLYTYKKGKRYRLIGYQLRRVHKNDKSPKYITRKNEKNYFQHHHKTIDAICLVEDYLSYLRVRKHVSAMCLFGTSLIPAMKIKISPYKRVMIFLDNDNSIVKKKQLEMQQELHLLVDNVEILKSDMQPKEFTDNSLISILGVY